jgi:hypothetical protein
MLRSSDWVLSIRRNGTAEREAVCIPEKGDGASMNGGFRRSKIAAGSGMGATFAGSACAQGLASSFAKLGLYRGA